MTLKKTLIEEKRKLLPGPEFRGVPLSANFCFNILFDLKTLYIRKKAHYYLEMKLLLLV